MSKSKKYSYHQIIAKEEEYLRARREERGLGEAKELDENKFGIALSGGGIRSATINMGLLHTLNHFNILEKADYLSTVSGGGYTGAYVNSVLKKEAETLKNPHLAYNSLFQKEHTSYMQDQGEYLMPGTGRAKLWNVFVLGVAYVVSTLMSWISPLVLIFIFLTLLSAIRVLRTAVGGESITKWIYDFIEKYNIVEVGLSIFLLLFIAHFIYNLRKKYHLGVSRIFNQVEAGLAVVVLFIMVFLLGLNVAGSRIEIYERIINYFDLNTPLSILLYVLSILLAVGIGYFANPNAISFHRFYRNQLANAYMHFGGKYKNVPLRDLIEQNVETPNNLVLPYPLINTCLNLQAADGKDANFMGAKASDYFLLSPFYFGSKLTGYVPSDTFEDYRQMTLPAATTISAAAVNPGMGVYSQKLLSIVMTLLNIRLGFWISNPLKREEREKIWWPRYFFKELFSRIGTENRKLNISDGGHIENLGVYELLRRRCRFIIAVDAGADPFYTFSDLELLTVRARNELGLSIEFRKGHIPEEVIRPKPSFGYSEERYSVADIYHIWEEIVAVDKMGVALKDERYKSFEILVNYSELKEGIKNLSYESKLFVRITFALLNRGEEAEDLKEQLSSLTQHDLSVVDDNVFIGSVFGQEEEIKQKAIRQVLTYAIEKEPEKIKPFLKRAKLLNKNYPSGVKIDKNQLEDLVHYHLEEKLPQIEATLLQDLQSQNLKSAYKVMIVFVDMLRKVQAGIEEKLIHAYLNRKIEDAYFLKILAQLHPHLPSTAVKDYLQTEPEDENLKVFLKENGLLQEEIQTLFLYRNQLRSLRLNKKISQQQAHSILQKQKNPFAEAAPLMNQIDAYLKSESLERNTLQELFNKTLADKSLTPSLASTLTEQYAIQKERVKNLSHLVSRQIEKQVRHNVKASTLVYVKSSVKAPKGKIVTEDKTKYGAYKYKIYHPSFPHESTADQFFDPVQWEAYYMLGQYLGAEVLGVKGLDKYLEKKKEIPHFSINDLMYRFGDPNGVKDLFLYKKKVVDHVPSMEQVEEALPQSSPIIEAPAPVQLPNDGDATPLDPEEEMLREMEALKTSKKVVAGKEVDYTI